MSTEVLSRDEFIWARNNTVFISCDSGKSGSGLLFYPKDGNCFYIITAAHILLEKTDAVIYIHNGEEYNDIRVTPENIRFSWGDADVSDLDEERIFRDYDDLAIVCIEKNRFPELGISDFSLTEDEYGCEAFLAGFPGGLMPSERLDDVFDYEPVIENNSSGEHNSFRLKLLNPEGVNQSDRKSELEGFSGAPVFIDKKIYGILNSGSRGNIFRNKLFAVKAQRIRLLMQNEFGITLPIKLNGIPEEDVAAIDGICIDDTVKLSPERLCSEAERWIIQKNKEIYAEMDSLQLQRAIELCIETIGSELFRQCNKGSRKKIYTMLLNCYDICFMFDEYDKTESTMRGQGLIEDHDTKRWALTLYSRRDYQGAIDFAKTQTESDSDYSMTLFIAEASAVLLGNCSPDVFVSKYLDDRQRLKEASYDVEEQTIFYQILGQIFSDVCKDYDKAVRCLNYAYSISRNGIVAESVAIAYYFAATRNGAVPENGEFKPEKINRQKLSLARKYFLMILQNADELYLQGTYKRCGGVIFETLVFSRDIHKSLEVYEKLKPILDGFGPAPAHTIELNYADIVCQSGSIDTGAFRYLSSEEKTRFEVKAGFYACIAIYENAYYFGNIPPTYVVRVRNAINWCENNINKLFADDLKWAYSIILNLYMFAISHFGWNAEKELSEYGSKIVVEGLEYQRSLHEAIIFESKHSYEDTLPLYLQLFETYHTFETWTELKKFYIRHERFEEADKLFEDLFEKYSDFWRYEPEFAVRAYILFVTDYRLDPMMAVNKFKKYESEFRDNEIKDFLTVQLMMATNTVSDVDYISAVLNKFLNLGRISDVYYHVTMLKVYMLNLRRDDAKEEYEWLCRNKYADFLEQHLYRRWICGSQNESNKLKWNGFATSDIKRQIAKYKLEKWHRSPKTVLGDEFDVNRCVTADYWGLYTIAQTGKLNALSKLDSVFVTNQTVAFLLSIPNIYWNEELQELIKYLEKAENVSIISPNFDSQIEIWKRIGFCETEAVMACAREKEVGSIIGMPDLSEKTIEYYSASIIRPDDFIKYADSQI